MLFVKNGEACPNASPPNICRGILPHARMTDARLYPSKTTVQEETATWLHTEHSMHAARFVTGIFGERQTAVGKR